MNSVLHRISYLREEHLLANPVIEQFWRISLTHHMLTTKCKKVLFYAVTCCLLLNISLDI